jgi:hypothetical protein
VGISHIEMRLESRDQIQMYQFRNVPDIRCVPRSFYLLNVKVVYAILIGSTYSICRYGEISNTIVEVAYEWRSFVI